jgi:hypothetical protein
MFVGDIIFQVVQILFLLILGVGVVWIGRLMLKNKNK